jgi:HTH-type transcriptional regulator/antitoxin HigA
MIEPIVDDASHKRALKRIEALWDAEVGTPEGAELDALATLVDAYERKHFPILAPDPIKAIELRAEQLGWSRKELEQLIGSRARVSEVLHGRRSLTLPMIRKIHAAMGIPAEVLIASGPGVRSATPRGQRRVKASRSRQASAPAQHAITADKRVRAP